MAPPEHGGASRVVRWRRLIKAGFKFRGLKARKSASRKLKSEDSAKSSGEKLITPSNNASGRVPHPQGNQVRTPGPPSVFDDTPPGETHKAIAEAQRWLADEIETAAASPAARRKKDQVPPAIKEATHEDEAAPAPSAAEDAPAGEGCAPVMDQIASPKVEAATLPPLRQRLKSYEAVIEEQSQRKVDEERSMAYLLKKRPSVPAAPEAGSMTLAAAPVTASTAASPPKDTVTHAVIPDDATEKEATEKEATEKEATAASGPHTPPLNSSIVFNVEVDYPMPSESPPAVAAPSSATTAGEVAAASGDDAQKEEAAAGAEEGGDAGATERSTPVGGAKDTPPSAMSGCAGTRPPAEGVASRTAADGASTSTSSPSVSPSDSPSESPAAVSADAPVEDPSEAWLARSLTRHELLPSQPPADDMRATDAIAASYVAALRPTQTGGDASASDGATDAIAASYVAALRPTQAGGDASASDIATDAIASSYVAALRPTQTGGDPSAADGAASLTSDADGRRRSLILLGVLATPILLLLILTNLATISTALSAHAKHTLLSFASPLGPGVGPAAAPTPGAVAAEAGRAAMAAGAKHARHHAAILRFVKRAAPAAAALALSRVSPQVVRLAGLALRRLATPAAVTAAGKVAARGARRAAHRVGRSRLAGEAARKVPLLGRTLLVSI